MKIFKATVCIFNDKEKTDFGYRYIKISDKCSEIFCIIEDDKAIDINTNKEYDFLRKDNNGYLLKEEFGNIQLNTEYVTNAIELKPEEKNIIMHMKAVNAKRVVKNKQKILKR